jgi:hypothetical protein
MIVPTSSTSQDYCVIPNAAFPLASKHADEHSEPLDPAGKPPSTESSDSLELSLYKASYDYNEESSEPYHEQELSDIEWSRVYHEESSPLGMSVCAGSMIVPPPSTSQL